jgi:hypothetical protein
VDHGCGTGVDVGFTPFYTIFLFIENINSFQITSDYDSESRAPLFFSWFFTFDCMDITWNFLSLFSIRRPSYISDELESLPNRNPDHPPITFHRILLSSIILLFGMSKAVLGYLGSEYSMAVTWLDWLLATVLMTG